MSAVLALGALGLYLVGLQGYRLVRDPGVGEAYVEQLEVHEQRTSLVGRLLAVLDRVVGQRVVRASSKESRVAVERALARAGRTGETYESVISRQATWAFLAGVLALLLLLQGSFLGLPFVVVGWFFPRLVLYLTGRDRAAAIDRELPDFLDVLAVTISAGLGFRAAMQRVSVMVGGAVGEEMLIALRQIEIGASRRAAFAELRERSSSVALAEFVTAYLQAEELGAPIGEFLTSYATDLRRTSGQKARKAAAQANPKISLVLTLVIMPSIALLMVGSIVVTQFL